jgi:hypothetical protein
MVMDWKTLLTENNVPENAWPLDVSEINAKDTEGSFGLSTAGTVTVVTYPSAVPVTVQNAKTGKNEWNPQTRDCLALIYKSYKANWGSLSAPTWCRSDNTVRFHAV